jgi:prepilin-type N-terminal cleavage/methylation domain-containing protein
MQMMKSKRQGGKRAFTLMEVVMALAVIGTMGAGAYVGFNSINTYAISSRLYTEAQACAQNQIDLILSKGPFDILNSKVPTVLGGGTCACQVLAANASTTVTTPNIFVYTDPVSGNVVATGTMTTKITNPADTMAFAGATTSLNTYLATVTVTYTYRNQTYNVSMDTARTADQ